MNHEGFCLQMNLRHPEYPPNPSSPSPSRPNRVNYSVDPHLGASYSRILTSLLKLRMVRAYTTTAVRSVLTNIFSKSRQFKHREGLTARCGDIRRPHRLVYVCRY